MDYTRFGRERVPAGNPEVILMDIGVSSETAKGEETAHPRVCSEGSFWAFAGRLARIVVDRPITTWDAEYNVPMAPERQMACHDAAWKATLLTRRGRDGQAEES
jgi:hypothetical protein